MNEQEFLNRVRQNRPTDRPPHPATAPLVRTLPADLVGEFEMQLTAVGGYIYRTTDVKVTLPPVLADLRGRGWAVNSTLVSGHQLLQQQNVIALLEQANIALLHGTTPSERAMADLGVTGAKYAIAASGTLVMAASAIHPRGDSLLPPLHIAIIHANQLLPDLAALAALNLEMPSGLAFITGPSKTADIEQTLSIGVHGPAEIHLILLED